MMSYQFKAVLFDFDGTLADTLADIAAVGNHAMEQLGRPLIEVQRYRYLAGQGIEYLIREALGQGYEQLVDEGVKIAREYQLAHGLELTKPYEGIELMLDSFVGRNIPMAILSNKPHAATCVAAEKIFGRWKFDRVLGHREPNGLKPDPAGAFQIAEEMGISPGDWLYVGDTRVDMLTGNAAGMFAVGVLWGFRDEAELREAGAKAIIEKPCQLLTYFE